MACPEAKEYLKDIRDILAAKDQPKKGKGSLAAQYLEYDRGGFQTRRTTRAVTVTTAAAVKIINEHVDRWSWMAVNISANAGYLAFTPNPSSTNGIYVISNGGNVAMALKEDGMLTENEVWAINNTADGIWYIVEEILI